MKCKKCQKAFPKIHFFSDFSSPYSSPYSSSMKPLLLLLTLLTLLSTSFSLPLYCSDPTQPSSQFSNQFSNTTRIPLPKNLPSSAVLLTASAVIRHGARTPYEPSFCWDGYLESDAAKWDCDTSMVMR